jgi:hypothetical protein
MLWKQFTALQTRRWIDILPSLVDKYNHRVHSTIQMSPADAFKVKNEGRLAAHMFHGQPAAPVPKFSVGDWVRVSRTKGIFEKS